LSKNTNKQDRQAQRIVSHRVDLQFTQYQNQRCTTYNDVDLESDYSHMQWTVTIATDLIARRKM